jgi:hypothetical protein
MTVVADQRVGGAQQDRGPFPHKVLEILACPHAHQNAVPGQVGCHPLARICVRNADGNPNATDAPNTPMAAGASAASVPS